ncbi:hypothetical protein M9H77_04955 [Catharanthus roseus]|uniref:Uncharacterized protein n=1 Tax=Catharanthus roseus TaxID=4058 RepID=A0ACC0CFV9_CATRO|nr:hypothetical protein M9H77_04955 [Catharanthus roseus]
MNMDATHLVRVVLFWDSKHARDAYGPYFTGAAKKTWTFTRMEHTCLVRVHQNKHRNMTSKFISITNITSCCQRSRDPYLERHPRSASITSDELYVQEGMVCLEIYNREGVWQLGDNFYNSI